MIPTLPIYTEVKIEQWIEMRLESAARLESKGNPLAFKIFNEVMEAEALLKSGMNRGKVCLEIYRKTGIVLK